MSPNFNLVEESWIPCIRPDGRLLELGLCGVLSQAHDLRELSGESPLVTGALHRLLLAILHRIHGPDSYGAWNALWQARRFDPEPLEGYFVRWRDRFDLFHPQRPFYQAADARVKPKSITSLVHDVASGNNATLFDHHIDAEGMTLTPAQAARVLVVAQAFGLAGLSGLPQKFTDGPCARGVMFLVQGHNLFETLMLNLLRYNEDHPLPRQPDDRPVWEIEDLYKPDRKLPYGYLDYLTWQNRRILLFPEGTPVVVREATVAPGLSLDSTVKDPMKAYRRDEKRGDLVVRFTEERALWRDSATFLELRADSSTAPGTYAWLAQLIHESYLSFGETRPTVALGMANNQAKVEFYRIERLSLPLIYLMRNDLVTVLRVDVLNPAEQLSRQLFGATRTLAKLLLSAIADSEGALQPRSEDLDKVMAPWGVKRYYWSHLEVPFRVTLERLPVDQEGALTDWQGSLRSTAWEALDRAAKSVAANQRAFKAVVQARSQLAAGMAKVIPAR